ncbi:MAG: sensor histidine kinase, partial [bacterium]
IGQSPVYGRRLFSRTLTDRLLSYAPEADIYIIPDRNAQPRSSHRISSEIRFSLIDILKCTGVFVLCIILSEIFRRMQFSEANIIMVFILGTVVNSVITDYRIYGLISAMVGVILFNYLFTEPRFTLFVYETGYQSTFAIMFLVAFITGSLAERLRRNARESGDIAYRTQILLDTNVMLEKIRGEEEILGAALQQLEKLLERKIVFTRDIINGTRREYEYTVLRSGSREIGSIGVDILGSDLTSQQRNLLQSVIGECSLALENDSNRKAREEAELQARSEKLRTSLLRTISHDLRTPLTSISGHAENLLANESGISPDQRMALYQDISDEARWLIDLVENLLSISRIENGRMQIQLGTEEVSAILEESSLHFCRQVEEHEVKIEPSEDIILVRADARLIMQVLINLVNNAVKYTQKGSEIRIAARRASGKAVLSVSDNGPGIPDDEKEKIFDMFYSIRNTGGDTVRSTGLGLSLCRSIVEAHGGEITVRDNYPCGAVFEFTLPTVEVQINE